MKKIVFLAFAVSASAVLAQLRPGEGVANDHALGSKPTDVVFVQRGGGNAYGYKSYDTILGVTVLPWSLPNFESSVTGIRLNLGWGSHAGMYGLDTGLVGVSESFAGVSATFLGAFTCEASGAQVGLVNVTKGHTSGLQIGLVNATDSLAGVQIGLLNFAWSQWSIPIVNVAW